MTGDEEGEKINLPFTREATLKNSAFEVYEEASQIECNLFSSHYLKRREQLQKTETMFKVCAKLHFCFDGSRPLTKPQIQWKEHFFASIKIMQDEILQTLKNTPLQYCVRWRFEQHKFGSSMDLSLPSGIVVYFCEAPLSAVRPRHTPKRSLSDYLARSKPVAIPKRIK